MHISLTRISPVRPGDVYFDPATLLYATVSASRRAFTQRTLRLSGICVCVVCLPKRARRLCVRARRTRYCRLYSEQYNELFTVSSVVPPSSS